MSRARLSRVPPLRVAAALAAVLVASSPALAQRERPDGSIELAIGERRVLPDDGVSSFSESGPGTFDVEFSGGHLVLVGRMAGTRSILLIFADGSQRRYVVTVRAAAPHGEARSASACVPR